MSKSRILLQLDPDPQPSVFDAVVAADAGVDHLLRHGGVTPDAVRELVHGTMFTRGPNDLASTAIFIGGSNVAAAEELLARTTECFFGPIRVSVMLDPNGANTTAAAAVLAAGRHLPLNDATVAVLGATGPVGRRVVRLLAREGATIRAASRSLDRAAAVCDAVQAFVPEAAVTPVEQGDDASLGPILDGASIVVAAGAAGVQLLPEATRRATASLRVAIDLNAVPPVGIEGVEVHEKAVERDGCICYGAIGVGGTKMKIHAAALGQLFEANDRVLDAEEIYALGRAIG
jgi:hypothetical protein